MIKTAMIRFDKLLGETPKAYLIRVRNIERWVPKSQCKKFTTNKKLGGNVILPTFIINDMFGLDINDDCPSDITPHWVIEHHVPVKVEPVKKSADADLTR